MNADIIRPRQSTTYVDAANCDRPSSVVCLSVTVVSHAKSADGDTVFVEDKDLQPIVEYSDSVP